MRSVYGSSTVGDRDHQEDDFSFSLANEHHPNSDVLLVLCDGMGGHVGGEVASATAVRAFEARFATDQSTDPQKRLSSALDAANQAIGEKIRQNSQFDGMGSTLVGAIKLSSRLVWVSVGDSHIYMFRGGDVTKLNADHSLFSELLNKVRKGEITMEEARSNPRKNALLSAVMGRDIALVDLNQVKLREGDMIVLASDGLDTLTDEQIKSILNAKYGAPPQEVTDALLEAVQSAKKPRQDNTSIVVCYHTTKTYPFWKEATHWTTLEHGVAGWSTTTLKKSIMVSAALVALILGIALFALPNTTQSPSLKTVDAPPKPLPNQTQDTTAPSLGQPPAAPKDLPKTTPKDTSILEAAPEVVVTPSPHFAAEPDGAEPSASQPFAVEQPAGHQPPPARPEPPKSQDPITSGPHIKPEGTSIPDNNPN